jgi:hypothetical protein
VCATQATFDSSPCLFNGVLTPTIHTHTHTHTHSKSADTTDMLTLIITHTSTHTHTHTHTHTGPDHPASKAASILSHSPFPLDSQKAYCTNSADVLHPLWSVSQTTKEEVVVMDPSIPFSSRHHHHHSPHTQTHTNNPHHTTQHTNQSPPPQKQNNRSCRLDPEASNATTKIYRKVPSRFRTGKGDELDDVMGQLAYFGQAAAVPVLYPSGEASVLADVSFDTYIYICVCVCVCVCDIYREKVCVFCVCV